MRGRNMDKLTAIFQSLQLDLAGPVRWQDARGLIMRTPEWHRDPELQRIEPIDMITVFEDEVQRAEKELAEVRQRRAEDRRRKARKAREGFNELLRELVQADQISAGTTWKSVYPLLAHDERYLALLGQPGSSPLDLFWDLVDDLDVQAEENQLVIEAVAKERGFVVDEATKEDDFFAAIKDDVRLESMDYTAIRATFEKVRAPFLRLLLPTFPQIHLDWCPWSALSLTRPPSPASSCTPIHTSCNTAPFEQSATSADEPKSGSGSWSTTSATRSKRSTPRSTSTRRRTKRSCRS